MISTKNFLEYSLFTKKLGDFPSQSKILINTINQYSYCIAQEDSEFKRALQASDVLLPDGIGVVIGAKFLTGENIKKIAGADVHHYLLNDLNKKNGSCFYLGSSDETLKKITERIKIEYPNVNIHSYSPPFKQAFSDDDNKAIADEINMYKPDVLFVGMTAPKQEKWVFSNKNQLDAGIICTIGAVFDFYAETVKRPSEFWISLGLEWLVRLVKEPSRMWKRYLYYGPIYIHYLLNRKFTT